MLRRFLDSRRAAAATPSTTAGTLSPEDSQRSTGRIGSGGSFNDDAHDEYNANSNDNDNSRESTRTSNSSTSNWSVNQKTLNVVAHTLKVEELYKFDSAIEASDQMAAAAPTSSGGGGHRIDQETGLSDCSVLVSADGELLIIPQSGGGGGNSSSTTSSSSSSSQPEDSAAGEHKQSSSFWKEHADELGDEYASAVFYGNDLQKHGDKIRNGFSMRGYSLPAATLCVKQTADALKEFEGFMEEFILTKKNYAVQEDQAIDRLRAMVMVAETALAAASTQTQTQRMVNYHNYLQAIFPPDQLQSPSYTSSTLSSFRTPLRVGPLSFPDGSIHNALVALEHYYSGIAESESNQWRKMTQTNGTIAKLRQSREATDERVYNRQIAIQEMIKRVKAVEDHLRSCKEDAQIQWNKVHEAEVKVTQLVETKMLERSRMREKQHLEQMIQQQGGDCEIEGVDGLGEHRSTTASSSDIWNLISEHAASMEDGSFEPMDLPQLSLSGVKPQNSPNSASLSPEQLKNGNAGTECQGDNLDSNTSTSTSAMITSSPLPEPLPLASRYEIEEECGLPGLRAAAVAADQAVEDAANSLLSVLHNLDTAKRSARLAAESCIVATCNAQADCIRSVIEIERANLNERLKRLDDLENVVKEINVRADIDRYISMDRNERGGRSLLGDDDDGGVASALAVLNNHIDGDISGGRTSKSSSTFRGNGQDGDDSPNGEEDPSLSTDLIEGAVNSLFRKNPFLKNPPSTSKDQNKAIEELESHIELLCNIGEDKSLKASSRRSTICYALNSRKSSYQQIPSSAQFDGLCRVFSAVLSSCDCNDSTSVLNSKLLLDLSRVFYLKKPNICSDGSTGDGKEFIKNRLIVHPLWTKDEFWDQALLQSVSESLSQSGVLSNFERVSFRKASVTTKMRSEYTDTHTFQWHDLKEEERNEAASQVHAVVFAQLGTMVDTMLEMDIGLDRRAAFVRRMSVRNQLPISQRTTLLRHLVSSADGDNKK